MSARSEAILRYMHTTDFHPDKSP